MSDKLYYVNFPFHKQNKSYRNSRKPKNRGWDSDPPPVDIYIPSPDILPYSDSPKFFPQEIITEKFPPASLSVKFFSQENSSEILSDEEALEYLDDLDWEPKNSLSNISFYEFVSTLGLSLKGQEITPLAKEEIRPEGYIQENFVLENYAGNLVPEIFVSQNSLES